MIASKKKLAVLVSGGGTNMQAIIDSIDSGNINATVKVVISSNKDAKALDRATKHGIKNYVASKNDYSSAKERDSYILSLLNSFQVDYVLLAGYLGIISDNLIDAYKNRIINIHPSLLPKFGGANYHGLNVHKAVIDAGEKTSGATVHFVDGGIDTGLIIDNMSLDVKADDTPESLQDRILSTIEHKLFVRVVKDLCEDKIKVKDNKVEYAK